MKVGNRRATEVVAAMGPIGGKGRTNERIGWGKHDDTPRSRDMSPEHIRIAELAKEDRARKFSSIAHLLTVEALHEAFQDLRKDASAGVDRVTHTEYAKEVQKNLQQLHDRLKNGTYRAQPLRRIYIPKEDGRQRPISIPSLEDKIVQKAVVELLNAI